MIMDAAMSELPLAIFSTLAPIGAGAMVTLALAFLTVKFTDVQVRAIDKMTAIPLVVTIVGFVASFFHLASPLHAPWVFSNIGSSPLSNEIAAGSLFVIVALIYWILAMAGKLKTSSRKALVGLVAVLGIIFACFVGAGYMMYTIASWNTVAVPISIVGFALLGGVLLGTLVLAYSQSFETALVGEYRKVAFVVALVGLVLALVGAGMQFGLAASIETSVADGAVLAASVQGYLIFACVCIVLAVVLGVYVLLKKKTSAPLLLSGTLVAVVGIFIARLVFYALQISVGL